MLLFQAVSVTDKEAKKFGNAEALVKLRSLQKCRVK